MKLGIFFDYQLPIIACFLLFLAMFFYWISLWFPKEQKAFLIGKSFISVSNGRIAEPADGITLQLKCTSKYSAVGHFVCVADVLFA